MTPSLARALSRNSEVVRKWSIWMDWHPKQLAFVGLSWRKTHEAVWASGLSSRFFTTDGCRALIGSPFTERSTTRRSSTTSQASRACKNTIESWICRLRAVNHKVLSCTHNVCSKVITTESDVKYGFMRPCTYPTRPSSASAVATNFRKRCECPSTSDLLLGLARCNVSPGAPATELSCHPQSF